MVIVTKSLWPSNPYHPHGAAEEKEHFLSEQTQIYFHLVESIETLMISVIYLVDFWEYPPTWETLLDLYRQI